MRIYVHTRVSETGWHTWMRLRNGDFSPLLTRTKTLRLCPSVPASDTCDGTWRSAWYIAKATLTTVSCRFMCRSDWNFLSWSQPIRLKMPSSGVGWGDIRDSPRPALCHLPSPWSKQKTCSAFPPHLLVPRWAVRVRDLIPSSVETKYTMRKFRNYSLLVSRGLSPHFKIRE